MDNCYGVRGARGHTDHDNHDDGEPAQAVYPLLVPYGAPLQDRSDGRADLQQLRLEDGRCRAADQPTAGQSADEAQSVGHGEQHESTDRRYLRKLHYDDHHSMAAKQFRRSGLQCLWAVLQVAQCESRWLALNSSPAAVAYSYLPFEAIFNWTMSHLFLCPTDAAADRNEKGGRPDKKEETKECLQR